MRMERTLSKSGMRVGDINWATPTSEPSLTLILTGRYTISFVSTSRAMRHLGSTANTHKCRRACRYDLLSEDTGANRGKKAAIKHATAASELPKVYRPPPR